MSDAPSPRETVRLLVAAARSEDVGFLAAAIAYYAFISTIPLVILAMAVASIVGGEALASAFAEAIAGMLTAEAEPLLQAAFENTAGRGSATIVGLVILGWSSLRLFRGLHTAFARIYGTATSTTFLGELRNAVVTLGAIAVAVSLLVGVLVIVGRAAVGGQMLSPLVTALLLPMAFYPLYYLLPDVNLAFPEAVPGAVLAGLGWSVLGWLFTVYASVAAPASVYGIVGTVLLALTWFYAGAILMILGAILNAVRAGRLDNRQVQQVAGPDDG